MMHIYTNDKELTDLLDQQFGRVFTLELPFGQESR